MTLLHVVNSRWSNKNVKRGQRGPSKGKAKPQSTLRRQKIAAEVKQQSRARLKRHRLRPEPSAAGREPQQPLGPPACFLPHSPGRAGEGRAGPTARQRGAGERGHPHGHDDPDPRRKLPQAALKWCLSGPGPPLPTRRPPPPPEPHPAAGPNGHTTRSPPPCRAHGGRLVPTARPAARTPKPHASSPARGTSPPQQR